MFVMIKYFFFIYSKKHIINYKTNQSYICGYINNGVDIVLNLLVMIALFIKVIALPFLALKLCLRNSVLV